MASLQQRTVKGHKYWYIVESRRVNGKPRPMVLEYLGTADRLLERLSQAGKDLKLKSYQFGDVAALLSIVQRLNIVQTINKYIHSFYLLIVNVFFYFQSMQQVKILVHGYQDEVLQDFLKIL